LGWRGGGETAAEMRKKAAALGGRGSVEQMRGVGGGTRAGKEKDSAH